jgi:hypothetical protein
LLAAIGVDGIIIATESSVPPPPAEEWVLAFFDEEGRVYHRRGGAYPELRSLESVDNLPNQKLADATISLRESLRLSLTADVVVPDEGKPAVLALARPYFCGYQAKIGHEHFDVRSYRGLIPIISLPPGTHGRLTISDCPWWLLSGVVITALCALVYLLCAWRCRISLTNAKQLA